jgi:hypothetical protein
MLGLPISTAFERTINSARTKRSSNSRHADMNFESTGAVKNSGSLRSVFWRLPAALRSSRHRSLIDSSVPARPGKLSGSSSLHSFSFEKRRIKLTTSGESLLMAICVDPGCPDRFIQMAVKALTLFFCLVVAPSPKTPESAPAPSYGLTALGRRRIGIRPNRG